MYMDEHCFLIAISSVKPRHPEWCQGGGRIAGVAGGDSECSPWQHLP